MNIKIRGVAAALVVCLGLSGCVTTGGPGNGMAGGVSSASGVGDSECSEGFAALGGALVGGLLAKGNNRVRGAALGAGVASLACMAWNFESRKTRSAAQVQQDFKAANRGRLPEVAQVARYEPRFSPTGRVVPGGQVSLNSSIDVVGGSRDAVSPVVEEELVITRPDGKPIQARKTVNDGGQGAGGYQSSFVLKMPSGVPEGVYPVQTKVYLNGQVAAARSLNMQVVRAGDGGLKVAALK